MTLLIWREISVIAMECTIRAVFRFRVHAFSSSLFGANGLAEHLLYQTQVSFEVPPTRRASAKRLSHWVFTCQPQSRENGFPIHEGFPRKGDKACQIITEIDLKLTPFVILN